MLKLLCATAAASATAGLSVRPSMSQSTCQIQSTLSSRPGGNPINLQLNSDILRLSGGASTKTVLVTGGVGYIGSHTVLELLAAGYDVIVIDNLCNSNLKCLQRVEKLAGRKTKFYKVDIRDKEAMASIFADHKIDSVIHFAGLKAVGESVAYPLLYYQVDEFDREHPIDQTVPADHETN